MGWSEEGQLLAVSNNQGMSQSRDLVGLDNMGWSEEGQLLAVSTTKVWVT
jgi:hypothetical protein